MNRNILVVLIVIVLIVLGGLLVFSQTSAKSDTQITFLSNTSLNSEDSVEFVLKDAQGNPLENQNVSILFKSGSEVERYSILTDSNGKGSLVLNESAGNYSITVNYSGDDKYNSCSASVTVTIAGAINNTTADYSTAQSSQSTSTGTGSSSSSQSSSGLSYDSELNLNYDSNGRVVGGQNDGASYEDLKNNKPDIKDGNLE